MRSPLDTIRMIVGYWRLSQDPNRLGDVFAISDGGANKRTLTEVAEFAARHPQGARALREGTRLGAFDLAQLKQLPPGTLGRVFADHMIENNLDPRSIPVPSHAPGDVRYVRTHLRETHDIWHVATGSHTDVAGEIGLQAFYLAQLPSRLSAVLISMAFLHLATKNIEPRDAIMTEIMRGWALGRRAKPLFGFEWAKHWATPLVEVRTMLGIDASLHEAAIPDTQTYVFRSAA